MPSFIKFWHCRKSEIGQCICLVSYIYDKMEFLIIHAATSPSHNIVLSNLPEKVDPGLAGEEEGEAG